jgi:hypothetical protein
MGFKRIEGGWRYDFGGLKTNTAADEMSPTKYPYAKNVRYVKSLQTRPGYQTLFATELLILTECPLPTGEEGVPYSDTLESIGGAAPLTWTISSGMLPYGLSLSTAGVLTGTPTTPGLSSFTIHLADSSSGVTHKDCQITIAAPVALTTSCPLPDATIGVPYSDTITATDGILPYVFTITGGTLPTGLTMDSDGLITGTPTNLGAATFTLKVTDALGGISTLPCQLTVKAAAFTFSDDFNRANGALGSDWNTILIGSGVAPQIIGNQFAGSAISTSEVVSAPAGNTQGSSIITWTGYVAICWGGPMALRNTVGINDQFYVLQAEDLGGIEPRGQVKIVKNVGGVFQTLASSAPITFAGNVFGGPLRLDWDVQATKTVLTGFVNGVQVVTVDDSDPSRFTMGKPGQAISTSTGLAANSWDNYSCTSTP